MFSRIARPSLAVCSSARNFSSSSQVCTSITLIVKLLTILYRASTSRSVYRSTGTLFQRLKEVQRNLDFAINFLCVIMNYEFLVSCAFFMIFVVFMIMLNILLNLPPYISLRNQDESRNLNYHPQLNVKLRKLLERRKSQRMK